MDGWMDWIGLDWMDGLSYTAVTARASFQSDAKKSVGLNPSFNLLGSNTTCSEKRFLDAFKLDLNRSFYKNVTMNMHRILKDFSQLTVCDLTGCQCSRLFLPPHMDRL